MNTDGSTSAELGLLARLLARRYIRDRQKQIASSGSGAAHEASTLLEGEEEHRPHGADQGIEDSGIPKKMKKDQ